MPRYKYRCWGCKKEYIRYKAICNIDRPEYCCGHEMERLFTASFQIIACREADKRENDMYGIRTKGGDAKDRLALYKQDIERQEANDAMLPDVEPEYTPEAMVESGLLQAARCGESGIQKWREENVVEREFKEDEAITVG